MQSTVYHVYAAMQSMVITKTKNFKGSLIFKLMGVPKGNQGTLFLDIKNLESNKLESYKGRMCFYSRGEGRTKI